MLELISSSHLPVMIRVSTSSIMSKTMLMDARIIIKKLMNMDRATSKKSRFCRYSNQASIISMWYSRGTCSVTEMSVIPSLPSINGYPSM